MGHERYRAAAEPRPADCRRHRRRGRDGQDAGSPVLPSPLALPERKAADDSRPSIEERYGSGQNNVPDTNPADKQIPLQFRCSAV
jgi:hypothetical protein